jgi:hypothetical protein
MREERVRKEASEIALDEIAAACGCAEWDYPGQVTRDVLAELAKLEAYRAILKGRTVPPTEAEREAHRANGGLWRCVATIDGVRSESLCFDCAAWPPKSAFEGLPLRRAAVYVETWWALDASGVLCAWPTVDVRGSR